MKKALTYISLVLLFVLQTSAGRYIKILGVHPNIVLTFALLYSMTNGTSRAACFGLVTGLLMDTASRGAFGFNALIMLYLSIIISSISKKFYYENKIFALCAVFAFSVVFETVSMGFTNILHGYNPFLYSFIRIVLPESIYNSVIAIPILLLTKWLNNEYIRGI